jgi:hypothetical protein
MVATPLRAALLLVMLAAAGCSSKSEMWPMLTGEPRQGDNAPPQRAASDTPVTTTPLPASGSSSTGALGTGAYPQPSANTGTFVGQKAQQLRGDQQRLQGQVADHQSQLEQIRADALENGQRYYSSLAAVNARLQIGTTPGNPNLVQQWNDAQANLDRIGDDIGRLNNLLNLVGGDSALAAYILDTTRAAFSISGAVDADHTALVQLEDDTNRTTVQIDRLLNDVSDDISRQTAYVNSERRNLTTLSFAIKNGELIGGSLANRSFSGGGAAPASLPQSSLARGRPLVVIKFDRQNVAYQQPLYSAVSQALDRRPDATFEIVAVAPNRGNTGQVALASTASRRNAEAVYRSLTDMGLPANKVTLSATTSGGVETNEVHVFVR